MSLIPVAFPPMSARADHDVNAQLRSLTERLQQAAGEETQLPVTPPEEELDPREAVDRFVRNMYANQFMQAMLFEDEELTGVKAGPWY